MANLFEQNRAYVLGDPELDIIGDRNKLAQYRHKGSARPITNWAARSSIMARTSMTGSGPTASIPARPKPMAKRFSTRKLSKNRHYTYDDASYVLGVGKKTLRAWRASGLPVIADKRPYLILGEDLIAFLKARQHPTRKPALDEFRCFQCRALKHAAHGIVMFDQFEGNKGRLEAECETCGNTCFKFFSATRLPELARLVEVVTNDVSQA